MADSVIGSRDGNTNLDDTIEHGISGDYHGDQDDACSEGEDEYASCWMASNGLTFRNRRTTWFVDEALRRKGAEAPSLSTVKLSEGNIRCSNSQYGAVLEGGLNWHIH